jgi:FKBP12-rapamycin complex-associated protein
MHARTHARQGPETLREVAFQQAYGRDLQEALDWCKRYTRSNRVADLTQAWDLYYQVFKRINNQLKPGQMKTLELQYCSPTPRRCVRIDPIASTL